MNICLLGYGKMGHEIESLGKEKGLLFPLIIDENNIHDLNANHLKHVDVVIDFSTPGSAPDNILTCLEAGIPVVSGTTGWNDRKNEIEARCKQLNGAFFFASNFSIGVNIFFNLNKQLATIMGRFKDYKVSLKEIHHTQKLDAPSGTAITLAEQIIENNDNISNWSTAQTDIPENLSIESIREGDVKGFHAVKYTSEIDEIEICHSAKSRRGFAMGAILAAEFIHDKHGLYGMTDLLKL